VVEILSYTTNHDDYDDIGGEIAPLMLGRPLSEMYEMLPGQHFIAWVRFPI
jgi:hypothetical protein